MAEANGCTVLPTRCSSPSIDRQRYNDDGHPTASSEEQKKVEKSVDCFFKATQAAAKLREGCPRLQRERHVAFLMKGLSHLPQAYQDLDASRPWLCYWILHSLELLEVSLYSEMKSSIAAFLGKCQHPEGGFSGGPGQQAHLAPTYAAVNALSILGTEEAYKVINRNTLYNFLRRMKQPDGSFIMHDGGEADVRCSTSVRDGSSWVVVVRDGAPRWPKCTVATRRKNQRLRTVQQGCAQTTPSSHAERPFLKARSRWIKQPNNNACIL
ncbi:hypothetical protein HPB49_018689 [Dermacentor silvarum]|uniref:Uncharacterized protein n=1 Tax=Dermacentor silvarum TaxID=543639 RepID=A0ACB8CGX4_DERSI|nr:hypothetical protein HPB49_018689 [Dermacentor silvarum]